MVFLFCFHNTSGEPYTIFNGIKQDLVDFKNETDSVLKNIKTEIQSKLDDIIIGYMWLTILLKVASMTKLMRVC